MMQRARVPPWNQTFLSPGSKWSHFLFQNFSRLDEIQPGISKSTPPLDLNRKTKQNRVDQWRRHNPKCKVYLYLGEFIWMLIEKYKNGDLPLLSLIADVLVTSICTHFLTMTTENDKMMKKIHMMYFIYIMYWSSAVAIVPMYNLSYIITTGPRFVIKIRLCFMWSKSSRPTLSGWHWWSATAFPGSLCTHACSAHPVLLIFFFLKRKWLPVSSKPLSKGLN